GAPSNEALGQGETTRRPMSLREISIVSRGRRPGTDARANVIRSRRNRQRKGSREEALAVTERDVLDALRPIQDPDLKRDIVSLGFVRNVRIEGDAVRLEIRLTTP